MVSDEEVKKVVKEIRETCHKISDHVPYDLKDKKEEIEHFCQNFMFDKYIEKQKKRSK